MQIPSFQNPINFKGATININALSDTHGHLELVDGAYQTLEKLKDDVFEKEQTGKQNYLIIGGDWGMSGDIVGFLTDPKKPMMWFQEKMLNKFIGKIKEQAPKTKVLFTPGNHDLDCGTALFNDVMKDFSGKILMTNLDFQKSTAFDGLIKKDKLVASQIDFVKDDKDKDKTHAVLNLGIMPVNLKYYGNMENIELIDNTKLPQNDVSPLYYRKTMETVKEEVDKFKKDYPNGTVILTCHTGAAFADNCARLGGIDLIFDAHEHKDEVRVTNGTPIVALSQNFQKIVNAKIEIDDSGENKDIKIKDIRPAAPRKEGELGAFYNELFKEDSKEVFTIQSKNDSVKKLDITNIRNRNNHLANFICDILLSGIKEKDPSVQIFALNASSMRGGFKVGEEPATSMFNVINCLNGISRGQADIYTNEVTGEELAGLIKDNFNFNAQNPERNPLIHYAGIKIDKTNFMKEPADVELKDLCKYITLEETNEAIDPNKTYKIANPEKYFIKSANMKIRRMKEVAQKTGLNVRDIFCDYFKTHPKITYETKTRLY